MEWFQVLVIVFGNAAWILPVFFWVRSESRADIRHMDNKMDAIRELSHSIHKETQATLSGIREEMKDFHMRLLEIERGKERK